MGRAHALLLLEVTTWLWVSNFSEPCVSEDLILLRWCYSKIGVRILDNSYNPMSSLEKLKS